MNRVVPWALVVLLSILATAKGQFPLLHYPFNEGGSPLATTNFGTLGGNSPLNGLTLLGTSPNTTPCLKGVGGSTASLATPLSVNFGNNSWSVGFAVSASIFTPLQYVCGGQAAFQVTASYTSQEVTLLASGASTVVLPVNSLSAFKHVVFVHDTSANTVSAYLDGTLVSVTPGWAPNINAPGQTLAIGHHGTTSLSSLAWIEDFRFYDYPLTASQVAGWAQSDLDGKPVFRKVMITEACPTTGLALQPAYEITNFGQSAASLTDWRLRVLTSGSSQLSSPINVSVAPEESVVIGGVSGVSDGVPPGTQVVVRFSTTAGTNSACSIALVDPIGTVMDEVGVTDSNGLGVSPIGAGVFRGTGVRTPGAPGLERIWGLDSNGGLDWTSQPSRTLGRENTSDGVRGTDPVPIPAVRINEVDDNPPCIELTNLSAPSTLVTNYLVWMSGDQGAPPILAFIPGGQVILAGEYMVLGAGATPPTEMPGSAQYKNIGTIPFTGNEYTCGLYDTYGRLVDIVRATSATGLNVHNHQRAPSYWSDFTGAAGRNVNGGDSAIGRNSAATDTDKGSDWFPILTRTMGSSNPASAQAGPAGLGDVLDVRLNATGLGLSLQAIINAGPSAAGWTFNVIPSLGHSNGLGPIMGLGFDALSNFSIFYHLPGFSGTLNSSGAGRIDINNAVPPGIDSDNVFFIENGTGVIRLTRVLEYDT
jgi:hypothetical protein